jgi:hypothetical protein
VAKWAEPQSVGARPTALRHVDELVAVLLLVVAFRAQPETGLDDYHDSPFSLLTVFAAQRVSRV